MTETLHFDTHFQANKQKIPIVLLHGWGLNSAVWQPFIDGLSSDFKEKFTVITIDLPGFGNNLDVKLTPYSLDNLCQHIAHTVKQPAIYLGWSLGGLISTQMALTYPKQVLALISVSSSPCFVEEEHVSWPGIKSKTLKTFHQLLTVDTEKMISNFLKIQAMGSPHVRQDIKQITHLVMQQSIPNKTTLNESLKLLETSDLRTQLKDITQPFFRLYGSGDNLVPIKVADLVTSLTNNSEMHIFHQASHAPFISHLNDFSTILTQWLLQKFKQRLKDNDH